MYDGNPGEIEFGSSQREVRVSEGSSYRESIVFRITGVRKLFVVDITNSSQQVKGNLQWSHDEHLKGE